MLKEKDQEVYQAIEDERKRQLLNIELIASENYVSEEVLEAAGSIMTNKYAEGYPGRRYYGGCENVDVVENLAKERLKKLFNAGFVNVQPHSGSQANMAAYRTLIQNHDRVMGMALDHGGHLTHGHVLSFSGIDYEFHPYFVDRETGYIDYDGVERIANEVHPKLIVAGASAYPRIIDFKRLSDIAKKEGAYLMVDMAHIAGLVAVGLHPSPLPFADIVTSTTHKTLRGPRGGIILTNNEDISKIIDRTVFPGIQGGPLMHIIAAKAVAFKEALEPSFAEYQKQIINNARTLAEALKAKGFFLVSGGTDNHMMLVDVKRTLGMTGKKAEQILDSVYITCNKNTVPFDTEKPLLASGIRLGTPAVTTRGFLEEEMVKVADFIDRALRNSENGEVLQKVRDEVKELTSRFPLHR